MHSVQVDHARALLDVRLSGFFDEAKAWRAIEDVRAAVRSLGPRAGQHLTLYDISAVEIAPGPTIELLKQSFADPAIRHLWARRVAYVSLTALGRIQIRRLREVRGDIGVFDSRDAALAWLLADDAAADAAGRGLWE